jgi:hypothetical protein
VIVYLLILVASTLVCVCEMSDLFYVHLKLGVGLSSVKWCGNLVQRRL